MQNDRPNAVSISWLPLGFVLASGLGCSTLDKGQIDFTDPTGSLPAVSVHPSTPPDINAFTVELREADKKPVVLSVKLDRVLHVQDAVEKSGAVRQFNRMTLELVRPLQNGRHHRLELRYDRRTKRVEPAFDYALRPGDRLVITEDTSNIIDDLMGSLPGQFGAAK